MKKKTKTTLLSVLPKEDVTRQNGQQCRLCFFLHINYDQAKESTRLTGHILYKEKNKDDIAVRSA